jgi:hypothetical protein
MAEIVFCRTRWEYQSYTDFWALVTLAQFPTVWLDEAEPGRDAVYIVSPKNGELDGVLPRFQGSHQAQLVWWCLERPDENGSITKGAPLPRGVSKVWLSDRWQAALEGPVKAQFVPLGSHEGLANGYELDHPYAYHWTHQSYANGRRQAIYGNLKGRMGPNAWGEERDRILGSTRFMVNVHQDRHLVCEPLRLALASAWARAVLSETCRDPFPYEPMMFDYDALVLGINLVLEELGEKATERGERNWDIGCIEYPFGECVKTAVKALLDGS